MRFVADENVPLPSVEALRAAGHDVAAVAREAPGSSDATVLEQVRREGRIVLTFDRDFGELVFRRGASGEPGVVFLRFVPRTPTEPAEVLLLLLLERGLMFEGSFTVVDRDHVRQRRLPSA